MKSCEDMMQELLLAWNVSFQRPTFKYFWKGPLSNWYDSTFDINGITYWCVEQYMMARKAVIFGDDETFLKIMDCEDAKEIKKLGRSVKNFNESIWQKECEEIVYDGVYAKFSQNPKLKKLLLKNHGCIFVEASPFDAIWGVKMGAEDTRINNPNNWQGQNKLGFIITQVALALTIIDYCKKRGK